MQNLQFSILLLLLFSVASHASMETDDNLIPVYHVITAEALPGLSDFMTPLLKEESEDLSVNWFIHRAQCTYLSWANQVNKAISKRQDVQGNGQLTSDEQRWQALISKYCHSLPQGDSVKITDTTTKELFGRNTPYFPMEGFISEMEESFSPASSYVQRMPSYEALSLTGFQATFDARRRIVLEIILFVLGRAVTHEQENPWAKFFTEHFRRVMRQFHCSRFIASGNPDPNLFQNCFQAQTAIDVKRSNQAIVLTDIALGEFQRTDSDQDSLDTYGYQPGFAFAGSSSNAACSGYKMAGSSVLTEAIVLISLMRRVLSH